MASSGSLAGPPQVARRASPLVGMKPAAGTASVPRRGNPHRTHPSLACAKDCTLCRVSRKTHPVNCPMMGPYVKHL